MKVEKNPLSPFVQPHSFDEDSEYLPSIERAKADANKLMEERHKKRVEEILIKNKVRGFKMTLLKLIGGVLALVAGFLFYFIFPGTGLENWLIPLATSVLGALGIKNWRESFELAKNWYKSKTIVSAVAIAVLIIALVSLQFFEVAIPGWTNTLAITLIGFFGGTGLWGVFDAINRPK